MQNSWWISPFALVKLHLTFRWKAIYFSNSVEGFFSLIFVLLLDAVEWRDGRDRQMLPAASARAVLLVRVPQLRPLKTWEGLKNDVYSVAPFPGASSQDKRTDVFLRSWERLYLPPVLLACIFRCKFNICLKIQVERCQAFTFISLLGCLLNGKKLAAHDQWGLYHLVMRSQRAWSQLLDVLSTVKSGRDEIKHSPLKSWAVLHFIHFQCESNWNQWCSNGQWETVLKCNTTC